MHTGLFFARIFASLAALALSSVESEPMGTVGGERDIGSEHLTRPVVLTRGIERVESDLILREAEKAEWLAQIGPFLGHGIIIQAVAAPIGSQATADPLHKMASAGEFIQVVELDDGWTVQDVHIALEWTDA